MTITLDQVTSFLLALGTFLAATIPAVIAYRTATQKSKADMVAMLNEQMAKMDARLQSQENELTTLRRRVIDLEALNAQKDRTIEDQAHKLDEQAKQICQQAERIAELENEVRELRRTSNGSKA